MAWPRKPPTGRRRRPRLRVRDTAPEERLEIYVRDHTVAASAGVRVAKRAARNAVSTPVAAEVARLRGDIEADRGALLRIVRGLGIPRPRVRETLAGAAQALGSLKLNGQVAGTSALTTVVELEALTMALRGQERFWAVMDELIPRAEQPLGLDIDAQRTAVEDQIQRATAAHRAAVQWAMPQRASASA